MKLRNLFYLLLALPLAFAACTEDETAPTPVVKDPVLTLKSDAILDFSAEGGAGEISYTLENAKEGVTLTAECAAEWVMDLTAGDKVPFTVAANDAEEARDAKITVKYDTESFEVAVMQAAKQAEPEPEPVAFEAKELYGEYYGDEDGDGVDNYFFALTDTGFDPENIFLPNATYYTVDLYVAGYTGEYSETMVIPVGEYELSENTEAGAFSKNLSYYLVTNEDVEPAAAAYEAGKLTVTETGMTLTVTIQGVEHTVTYAGECVVDNAAEAPAVNTVVELEYAKVIYFGDYYTPGTADNFVIMLSDKGWDQDGWEYEDGNYYKFDTYTECIDKTNGIAVPCGTYMVSSEYNCAPGNVAMANYFTGDWEVDVPITEGTFTVNDNGFVAEVIVDGEAYKLVFNSTEYYVEDATEVLGGGEESISTLTENVSVSVTGATVELVNLGDDYVWGCNNYLVYIYEDAAYESGVYMMFDILVPTTAANIAGTYDINDWEEPYTGYRGYYSDYDDEYYGCWYVNFDTGDMAPICGGTVDIEIAEDGAYTFTFECYDDADYEIAGTIKCAGNDDEGGNTSQNATMWPIVECVCSWSNGSTAADYTFKTANNEDDSCDQFKFEFTGLEDGVLTDGFYSSVDGTINLNYCMHLYYSNNACKVKSAEATVSTVDGQTTIEAYWIPDNGTEQLHGFKWTGVLPEYDI